jgi:hypothetical protein
MARLFRLVCGKAISDRKGPQERRERWPFLSFSPLSREKIAALYLELYSYFRSRWGIKVPANAMRQTAHRRDIATSGFGGRFASRPGCTAWPRAPARCRITSEGKQIRDLMRSCVQNQRLCLSGSRQFSAAKHHPFPPERHNVKRRWSSPREPGDVLRRVPLAVLQLDPNGVRSTSGRLTLFRCAISDH